MSDACRTCLSPDMLVQRPHVQRMLREHVRPEDGKIPAFIFRDRAVYDLELEAVFSKVWGFVCHESEVPEPGDYVTRYIGEDPVIVSRGEEGQVRVFLNACTHRGMRIARSDMGNSSHFRCPYHGFTFTNSGALTGVPFAKDAYAEGLDRSKLALIQARVESYKGLVFATFNESAEPLDDFLGDMRWYLDLVVGRAPMEVVGPPQRWEVKINWKLGAENFMCDAYHTVYAHGSMLGLGLIPSASFAKEGYHMVLPNGHGLGIGMPTRKPLFAPELLPEFERNLQPEQVRLLKQMRHLHANVFPSLSILISGLGLKGKAVSMTTLRLWRPKGPDKLEIWSWFLVEKDAPEYWKELSRQSYVLTFGPSGIFEQDDDEILSQVTANYGGSTVRRMNLNYSMGQGRTPVADFPGPGEVYEGQFTEANARTFYRYWLDRLLEAPVEAGVAGDD